MRGKKRENMLRVLLTDQGLSKSELAKRARCTRQWVIEFLEQLERKGFVKGTQVVKPKELFMYWQSIHKKPKWRMYMVKDPMKLLKQIPLDYAVTTYKAENLVQQYLFPSRTDVYIKEEEIELWHKIVSKEGLVGGGNFRLFIVDNDTMYGKRKLNKIWIVSIAQLIIDLLAEGAMCVEAAEMLMEKNYHV